MTKGLIYFAAVAAFPYQAADPNLNPKEIFYVPVSSKPGTVTKPGTDAPPAARPAIKFRVELNQNGQASPVAASYRFRTGDRFRLVFELNQSSFIYVINRSIQGDPDAMGSLLGTKGINVVDQGVTKEEAPKFQLLWPPPGGNARLNAGRAQAIPGQTQFFEFDGNPGMEKISVLVSPYPVDPARYFKGLPTSSRPSTTANRQDTNEDVLSQLQDLRSMESNTATDVGATRGICLGDCSQYSAPKNPAKPFFLTVDLMHRQ